MSFLAVVIKKLATADIYSCTHLVVWHTCCSGPDPLSYCRSALWKLWLIYELLQKQRGWSCITIMAQVSCRCLYSNICFVNTAVCYIMYEKIRFTLSNYWISEMQCHLFLYLNHLQRFPLEAALWNFRVREHNMCACWLIKQQFCWHDP